MSTQEAKDSQQEIPFCRWAVTIHDSGCDYRSPEFATYVEMRQWESDWYARNRASG